MNITADTVAFGQLTALQSSFFFWNFQNFEISKIVKNSKKSEKLKKIWIIQYFERSGKNW